MLDIKICDIILNLSIPGPGLIYLICNHNYNGHLLMTYLFMDLYLLSGLIREKPDNFKLRHRCQNYSQQTQRVEF